MIDRTKRAAELAPGDIVTRWPDEYHEGLFNRPGEWTVSPDGPSRPDKRGVIGVEHTDGRGLPGVWELRADTAVTVRANPRKDMAAGLRALADLIEEHEGLVDYYESVRLQHSISGAADEVHAEVDRIAEILGVKADQDGEHYRADIRLGPVTYTAVAFPREDAKGGANDE